MKCSSIAQNKVSDILFIFPQDDVFFMSVLLFCLQLFYDFTLQKAIFNLLGGFSHIKLVHFLNVQNVGGHKPFCFWIRFACEFRWVTKVGNISMSLNSPKFDASLLLVDLFIGICTCSRLLLNWILRNSCRGSLPQRGSIHPWVNWQ